MKVVHFANHFYPRIGGVELSVAHTAAAQSRRGYQVTVLTETPAAEKNEQPYSLCRFSVPLVRPFTRLFYWWWMWKNRKWLSSADVLHFHDYTTFLHWFFPLRLLIHKPLYAITFHGFEGQKFRARHKLFRSITAHCMHLSLGVGTYLSACYKHRFDAFYLGAPVRNLSAVQRGHDPIFSFAGRIAHDTGILPFARALAAAAMISNTGVELRLVGDGPLRHRLSEVNSQLLQLRFIGVQDDLAATFGGTAFIVATGFLAVFDAFTSGIPVVIPAYSTLKRQYFNSIPDIDAMAFVLNDETTSIETLQRLLNRSAEQEALQNAEKALDWVSGLTWDRIAAMLDTLYSNAVKMRHRPIHKYMNQNKQGV